MTNEQLIIKLTEMKVEIDTIISTLNKNEKMIDKEETFLSIIKDYVIKEDREKYPGSIFYLNSDGKVLFELEKSTLWCNYELIWEIFHERYGMKYYEIQSFIKDMVEKHFKLRGVTPAKENILHMLWWRNISN